MDRIGSPFSVEGVVALLYLPVVANLDSAAIRQSGPADTLVRQFGLRFA